VKKRVDISSLRPALRLIAAMAILNFAAMAQNVADGKPSPQQSEWQDLEFGVIIDFGTNTFLDREWGDGKATSEVFAPTELDPDQWMPAINSARQFANAARAMQFLKLISPSPSPLIAV
jgi:alpha-L-fucosidase